MGIAIGSSGAPGYNYPPMVAGRYYRMPNGTLTTSVTLGIGTLRLTPKFVPNPVTLTRIGAETTVIGDVGSVIRLGIYANVQGDFRPGALVLDAGTIPGDAVAVSEIVVAQAIAAGWFWFGAVIQNDVTIQPTIRATTTLAEPSPIDMFAATPTANMSGVGYLQSGVAGALPANATPAGLAATVPSIFVKT